MNKAELNIVSTSRRLKSLFLAFIYILVLTTTIIHHHPIDLGTESQSLQENLSEKVRFSFTAEECPIIAFAQNGFNSLCIQNYDAISLSFYNTSNLISNQRTSKLNYLQTNFLRGPPIS
jgi:hypothetical protein